MVVLIKKYLYGVNHVRKKSNVIKKSQRANVKRTLVLLFVER